MTSADMLRSHPAAITVDRIMLARVIDTVAACARTCTACADACLSEDMIAELRTCIGSNLDCADSCTTTARILSRHTGFDAHVTRTQLEACIAACRACGDRCAQHADMHEHCRICAAACRACEEACQELLAAVG